MQENPMPSVAFYPGLQLRTDTEIGTILRTTETSVVVDWPTWVDDTKQESLLRSIQAGDITVEPAVGMRIDRAESPGWRVESVGDDGVVTVCHQDDGRYDRHFSSRCNFHLFIRTGVWKILPPEQTAAEVDEDRVPENFAAQACAMTREQSTKPQPRIWFYYGMLLRRARDGAVGRIWDLNVHDVAVDVPTVLDIDLAGVDRRWSVEKVLRKIAKGRLSVEPSVGMRVELGALQSLNVRTITAVGDRVDVDDGAYSWSRAAFYAAVRSGDIAILPPEPAASPVHPSLGSAGTSRTWESDGWSYRVGLLADLTDEEIADVERVARGLKREEITIVVSDAGDPGGGLVRKWVDGRFGCYATSDRFLGRTADLPLKPLRISVRRAEPAASMDDAPTSTGEDDETSAPAAEPTSDDLSYAMDAESLASIARNPDRDASEICDVCRAGASAIHRLRAELEEERSASEKMAMAFGEVEARLKVETSRANVETKRAAAWELRAKEAEGEAIKLREKLEPQTIKTDGAHDRAQAMEHALRDQIRQIERDRDAAVSRADGAERRASELEAKLRRAEASELLYENELRRLAEFIQGCEPRQFSVQELDSAAKAGVDTTYATRYYRCILGALTRAKEIEARAREFVERGLDALPEMFPLRFVEMSENGRFGSVARHNGGWACRIVTDCGVRSTPAPSFAEAMRAADGFVRNERNDLVSELHKTARAERSCPILHTPEVGSGAYAAAAIGATGCVEDDRGHATLTRTSFDVRHWGPADGLDAGGGF